MASIDMKALGFSVLMGGALLLGSGCVSYTNVPVPNSAPAFKHANSGASIKSMVAALDRVILKHPMRDSQGRYALNLPAGTTPETASIVVSRLPKGAMLPYEGMEESVPVYHISRIWLRGASGKVDVVYPIDAETDGGVTVWVHGGDRSWYVERLQYWSPGTVPTPPLYIPIDGAVDAMDVEDDVNAYDESISNDDWDDEPVMDEGELDQPAAPAASEPADDGAMYRQVDN
tara:strand:- start:177234 stop:177926 length:693 start_codon:yes stop_codon:yes gene_type:complete